MTIQENIPLGPLTTFKLGGNARYYIEVFDADELEEALSFAQEKKVPFFVLGGGSNIVVSDQGFPGLVIKMLVKGIEMHERGDDIVEVVCGAGEVWDDVVRFAVERNLAGLENLSLIPGSAGAAPVQNIGAYGSEVKDTLQWVDAFDPHTGDHATFSKSECEFDYRFSFFKKPEGKHLIVTRVAFMLRRNGPVNLEYKDVKEYMKRNNLSTMTLQQVRDAVIEIRTAKLPDLRVYGTAGSFFKNPIITKAQAVELAKRFPGLPSFPVDENHVKLALGWILDNVCHIKGIKKGTVGVYEKQALVLVNFGDGRAEEIRALASEIISLVKEKIGIDIFPEVEFVGAF